MEDIFLYNQIRRAAAEDILSSSDRTTASRAAVPYTVSASAGRCNAFLPCCRTSSRTIFGERAPLLGVLRLVHIYLLIRFGIRFGGLVLRAAGHDPAFPAGFCCSSRRFSADRSFLTIAAS
jgi:hypothetical protein